MMEIMDKYIEAGEALAEKENDARQLKKQVQMQDQLYHSVIVAI